MAWRWVFWLFVLLAPLTIVRAGIVVDDLNLLIRDGVVSIPAAAAAAVVVEEEEGFGTIEDCTLHWPLNGSEAFIHSWPVPKIQRRETLVLSCRRMVAAVKISIRGESAAGPQVYTIFAPSSASGGPIEVNYLATYQSHLQALTLDVSVCADTDSCASHFAVHIFVVSGSSSTQQPSCRISGACALHPMAATLDSRDDLGVALPLLVPNATTLIEVGVQEGKFAELLLATAPSSLRHYVGIDPWTPQSGELYVDAANHADPARHAANLQAALRRLGPYHVDAGGRTAVTLLKQQSPGAASIFKDESLCVVYLDGRHDYASVRRDLEAWWPKVRRGGLLAGHDYLNGVVEGSVFGVRAAVDKFARDQGLLLLATRDASFPTFLLFKP